MRRGVLGMGVYERLLCGRGGRGGGFDLSRVNMEL